MELQIQDLISSIKKDGIESANAQADAILSEAKKQSESILAKAREQAERLKEDARAEAEVFRSSAMLSAEQAKRDAILSFRREIERQTREILAADVQKALDVNTLSKLLVAAAGDEDPAGYVMEVNEVSDALRGELAEKLKAGMEICPSDRLRSGFRLVAKDGSGYIDCSDEELLELLSPFFREMRL